MYDIDNDDIEKKKEDKESRIQHKRMCRVPREFVPEFLEQK